MSKSFREITEMDPTTLLVVDGLNLAFRWKHSKTRYFAEDYIKTVESLAKSYKTPNILVAADWGSSSYRKALYPQYKANREEKFADQTEAEKRAFQEFIEDYNETLEHIQANNMPLLRFKGVEADDIAAYIASRHKHFGIKKVWLISTDKDWDLFVSDDVSRFSYITRKEITIDNWSSHYEWTPEEFISIKCLMGDAGDNVIGVKDVGPKRALGLVREYGSAMDVAMALPLESKYKFIKNINDFGSDNILLNYKLMDLVSFCRDAIGQENIKEIDKVLESFNHGT